MQKQGGEGGKEAKTSTKTNASSLRFSPLSSFLFFPLTLTHSPPNKTLLPLLFFPPWLPPSSFPPPLPTTTTTTTLSIFLSSHTPRQVRHAQPMKHPTQGLLRFLILKFPFSHIQQIPKGVSFYFEGNVPGGLLAFGGADLHDPPWFGLVAPEGVGFYLEGHGGDGVDFPDVVLFLFFVGITL